MNKIIDEPITVIQGIKRGEETLAEAGVESPRLDSEVILTTVLGLSRTELLARLDRYFSKQEWEEFIQLIGRRSNREPLQYIIGFQEFMSLNFKVNSAVLIPRADTEILVEKCLKFLTEHKETIVVDVGTGSGAICLSLAQYGPQGTYVGIDISEAALEIAQENYKSLKLTHQLNNNVSFLAGDLLDPLNSLLSPGTVNLIVSNPPYIPEEEVKLLQPEVLFEPVQALAGGVDGLDYYREIAAGAHFWLADQGALFFEIGYNQGLAVANLLQTQGYSDIQIFQDLAGRDRVVCGYLNF